MGRFTKGLVKDTSAADQPQGTWRFARNVLVNKVDGAISNEGGNKPVVSIGRRAPIYEEVTYIVDHGDENLTEIILTGWGDIIDGYSIIGAIEISDDRVVIFSVNRYTYEDPQSGDIVYSVDYGRSEVGVYKAGSYHTVLNLPIDENETVDKDLKFDRLNPISGTYKIDAQGNLFVYWTDNVNPPRCLNITRQEKAIPGGQIPSEKLYGISHTTSPNKNYIDRLNLFPHSGPVPHVEFESINSGGGLTTGAYSLALAYVDADLVATNYLTVDNPVFVVDDVESVLPIERYDGAEAGSQTGKSITWNITNINTDYDYLRPVIIQTVEGVRFAYQLSDLEIPENTRKVTFTGTEGYTQASVEDVIIDTVSYSTAKTLEQVDSVMYAGNLKGTLDVGFQKYAAGIILKPKLKEFSEFDLFSIVGDNINNGFIEVAPPEADKENGYKSVMNSYKYRGYTRDEVYAFYIAFILNDGTMSYAYHIPGRKAEGADLTVMADTGLKDLGPEALNFNFIDSSADSDTGMNYWRNINESYPSTDNFEGDGFVDSDSNRNVRHHHFPSNSTNWKFYTESTGTDPTVESADVNLSWTSNSGGSNVEYSNSDAGDIFPNFNGSTWISVMAMIVQGYETMEVGDLYTISWVNNNAGDPEYNEWTAELLDTTNEGWCLFDTDASTGGDPPNDGTLGLGNSESNWGGAAIVPKKGSDASTYMNVTEGTTSSTVQALGFELENIVIPAEIASKVQGFRVYYAKREHKNKTILGQGIVTPYWATNTETGGCSDDDAGDIGSNNEEDLWVKYPFHTSPVYNSWESYDSHPLNKEGLRTLAFYSFELLRTKDSVAAATHFSIEGNTTYHTWLGAGVVHSVDDAICRGETINSTFGVMSDYTSNLTNTAARYKVINERCKTYVKGNSIFDARGLGFGYKLYNRGGESHIALGVDKNNALDVDFFADSHSAAITEWNLGSVPFNFLESTRLKTLNINLRAFKTDVYNSIDSQLLVWTGFEVVGNDINNFIEGGEYINGDNTVANFNTSNLPSAVEGIYGGDTYLCRYGVRQSLYPILRNAGAIDRVSGFYTIVETTDNLNYRHEISSKTTYFPGSPAKKFLFSDRAGKAHEPEDFYDYTAQDNTKYNSDYSMVNDIRPAIPLPLLTSQPTAFPTRIQRSAKSDPGSLIDNFRVFLALQYKDLPKNRGNVWNLSTFNNLLYIHMEDSLYVTKGKEKLQLGDASEAFIGSGDLFAQDPDELMQTEAGHGGTRSQYAALVTKYGYFSPDRRNNKVYLTGQNMQDISNLGMEKWFQKNMPFDMYNMYGFMSEEDSPILGVGFTSAWDEKYQRILLTKRDLAPTRDFQRRFEAGLENGTPYLDTVYLESTTVTEEVEEHVFTREDIDFTVFSDDVYEPPLVSTYRLSVTDDRLSIDEGDTTTITLTTTNVPDGPIPYSITGTVSENDYTVDGNAVSSGVFTIVNGTASLTILAIEDNTTEGTPETLTLTLDEANNINNAITINIADTSLTPYILITSSDTVNEGDSVTLTLTTNNVPDGGTVAYTIVNNSGEFGAESIDVGLTGTFTVNSNSSTLVITASTDTSTESSESFTLSIDGKETSITITIVDTTVINEEGGVYEIGDYVNGGYVYKVFADGLSGMVVADTDFESNGSTTVQWYNWNVLFPITFEETEWEWPTLDQLLEVYDVHEILESKGGFNPFLSSPSYASSTEHTSNNRAWSVSFSNGNAGSSGKGLTYLARGIKSFDATASRIISPKISSEGIRTEVTGAIAGVNLTAVTSNSFTMVNTTQDTAEAGIKLYVPNNLLSFPVNEEEMWGYTLNISLATSLTKRSGSGIVIGDVSVIDDDIDGLINVSSLTSFTPTSEGDTLELYFKLDLNQAQEVVYTVESFDLIKSTEVTVDIEEAVLDKNGAIVLNRAKNRFELIGYNELNKQTRTVVRISEDEKFRGVKQFTRTGWTASYYPELKFWGAFHDYIPSLYTYDSGSLYSFDNDIPDANLEDGTGMVWGESIATGGIIGGLGNATAVEGIVYWGVDPEVSNNFWWSLLPSLLDPDQVYQVSLSVMLDNSEGVESTTGIVFSIHVGGNIMQSITAEELIAGPVDIEFQVSDVTGFVSAETNPDNLPGFSLEFSNFQVLPYSHTETDHQFNNIWKHDDLFEPGNFYGTLYPSELEFIDNTERAVTKLFSSFGYETAVNRFNNLLHNDGFTSFFVYTSSQCSGETPLKYFKSSGDGAPVRRSGSEWKVNEFRDMSTLAVLAGDYTSNTLSSSETQPMFDVKGMYEKVNILYIDDSKPWHQQKKFIDTFVGIRLINDNSNKNLVDLYATTVAMRKYNR